MKTYGNLSAPYQSRDKSRHMSGLVDDLPVNGIGSERSRSAKECAVADLHITLRCGRWIGLQANGRLRYHGA